MQYVWLTSSDGQWCARPLTEQEAVEAKAKGSTVVIVRDRVWAAWQAHIDQGAVFDTMWLHLSNEDYRERGEG